MEQKKPSLKIFFSLIAGIIAFFSIVIAIQEYTLSTWETLYLKTAPVDPRDLLRGDYVTLRYEFETNQVLKDYILSNNIQDNTSLYVVFEKDNENIGTVSRVSEIRPDESETFLKIKTESQWWWRTGIYTGIGKFFVPEWTGRIIERIRWDLLVEIKVDMYGTAKIVDLYYEWQKINPKTFRLP